MNGSKDIEKIEKKIQKLFGLRSFFKHNFGYLRESNDSLIFFYKDLT